MQYFSENEVKYIKEKMKSQQEIDILEFIKTLDNKVSVYFRYFYREEENFEYGNFDALSKSKIDEWRLEEPFIDLIMEKVIVLLGEDFKHIPNLTETLRQKIKKYASNNG